MMNVEQKKEKEPMSQESIYRVMLILVFGVSAVFLVKNIVNKDTLALIVIGAGLLAFAIAVFILRQIKAKAVIKQVCVSMGIVGVVFIISLFSGASFSDDFALYLAVMGLSGLNLKPKLTFLQMIAIDI